MSNPIFKETIAELEPLTSFIKKVGFDNLMMKLYLATFLLGGLSFLLPIVWGASVGLVDLVRKEASPPAELPKGKRKRDSTRAKKGKKTPIRPSGRPGCRGRRSCSEGSCSRASAA